MVEKVICVINSQLWRKLPQLQWLQILNSKLEMLPKKSDSPDVAQSSHKDGTTGGIETCPGLLEL